MDLQLKDKVVIVTGGAKGIGAAIVRACAAEGAVPVIVGRDAEAGAELQGELQNAGGRLRADHAWIWRPPRVARNQSSKTVKEFGRSDALVNNAGRNDKVGLEDGNPSTNMWPRCTAIWCITTAWRTTRCRT